MDGCLVEVLEEFWEEGGWIAYLHICFWHSLIVSVYRKRETLLHRLYDERMGIGRRRRRFLDSEEKAIMSYAELYIMHQIIRLLLPFLTNALAWINEMRGRGLDCFWWGSEQLKISEEQHEFRSLSRQTLPIIYESMLPPYLAVKPETQVG